MTFSKDDILDALGIETASSSHWILPALIGAGVGAVVGATVAMLVAPKSGSELREDLYERGRDLVQRGRDQVSHLAEETLHRSTTPTPPNAPKY